MWADNETGVLFPVESIAEICHSRGVLYHCDAVQAAGKVEIDVRKIPADYLSLAGHKFHAPKGIGALYVRRKSPFSPLVYFSTLDDMFCHQFSLADDELGGIFLGIRGIAIFG
jgi:cysteine sulfinate desulfinase/cysteine desulfurase-like protein